MKKLITAYFCMATMFLSAANAQGQGRRGMPAESRDAIHGLFEGHSKIERQVTVTDDGYISTTTSKDKSVVALLHKHVSQMEARMEKGLMVRRWDPAFAEFVEYYSDMKIDIEKNPDGLTITTTGSTDAAKEVARNHAEVISKFVANGWDEHDQSHPAVLTDAESKDATKTSAEKCCKSCPADGAPCPECENQEVKAASLGSTKPAHQVGTVYLAGQIGKDDVKEVVAAGIKTVINLRHEKEMADFDEKDAIEAAGLTYVSIPWKAPNELTDEVFDNVRAKLSSVKQPVLLHCGSSNRAGAVWLPWQVIDRGVAIEEAVAAAKKVGLATPEYEAKARDYIRRQLESKVTP